MDPYDWKRDYSLSDFDTRHSLSINSTWELPFGPGKALASGASGFAGKLSEGWQVGGVFRVNSSSPATINNSSGDWSRSGLTSRSERPDLAEGGNQAPEGVAAGCSLQRAPAAGTPLGTPDLWYDPCAYRPATLGFYGNLGRNTLAGPGQVTVNFSLTKNTGIPAISEAFRVQFRAEFFNLMNTPTFNLPNLRPLDNQGRVATTAGRINTTSGSSRQIQFGLKFIW
jgi:hypothetical protein